GRVKAELRAAQAEVERLRDKLENEQQQAMAELARDIPWRVHVAGHGDPEKAAELPAWIPTVFLLASVPRALRQRVTDIVAHEWMAVGDDVVVQVDSNGSWMRMQFVDAGKDVRRAVAVVRAMGLPVDWSHLRMALVRLRDGA